MTEKDKAKDKRRFWIPAVIRRCFADLQKKYDWFMYCRAYHPIRRMCENNPGMAYLMELTIKEWLETHPISNDLKHATEVFHDAMRRQNNAV
jgi:hypothetical protein